MQYARIRDGLVVNIELGDDDWPVIGSGADLLVPYSDSDPAFIGGTWSARDGFNLPPLPLPTE